MFLIHYFDDFLVIEAPDSSPYVSTLHMLRSPNHRGETRGPDYLFNIQIDSQSSESKLQLSELQQMILHWLVKEICIRKKSESLIGYLAHASHVVQDFHETAV